MAISTSALTSVSKNIPGSLHSYPLGEATVPSELISISLPYNPCCNFKSMNPVEPVFWAWNNPTWLVIFHHLQDLQYCSWKKLQEDIIVEFPPNIAVGHALWAVFHAQEIELLKDVPRNKKSNSKLLNM